TRWGLGQAVQAPRRLAAHAAPTRTPARGVSLRNADRIDARVVRGATAAGRRRVITTPGRPARHRRVRADVRRRSGGKNRRTLRRPGAALGIAQEAAVASERFGRAALSL